MPFILAWMLINLGSSETKVSKNNKHGDSGRGHDNASVGKAAN